MKNLWNDRAADAMVADYAAKGVAGDLALRVYTTRLLGGEPRLVLHGGGNTSLKTKATDILGHQWDVLCVKGSGWDMGVIEPAGLPAVKLAPLLEARRLDRLGDEDMVALQRANLLDPAAPNPSIETLLHAFLPHKFVDHTHSTAILALVDQKDSEPICRKVFGKRLGFVPYIKPGFDLAKAAADVYDADPSVDGLILDKHGIFTFAEEAKDAYGLMIEFVTLAEEHVAKGKKPFVPVKLPAALATPAAIGPYLRGAIAIPERDGGWGRMVSDFRTSRKILDYVNAETAEDLAGRGVSTPDLSIRIKTGPMVLPAPEAAKLDDFGRTIRERVAAFSARYRGYFEENDACDEVKRTMLDTMPRLTLVRGLGLFGHGRSLKEAKIAADVGEMLVEAVTGAEAVGSFHPLPLSDLFELEYWSLEQAKLAANRPKPLSGQVALVTGGAGAIGAAVAKLFATQGAHMVVVDLDGDKAAAAAARAAGNGAIGVAADVTDPNAVRAAFDRAVEVFGGVDIVISNAGAAWEGKIGEISDELLRRSFELNFFAHQSVAQNAVRIFRMQGTGGVLLFNTSKQAVNPGPNFGAYGLPKAATLFLSRQYALDYGAIGVRACAVNADRVRSGLLTDEMIANRAKARGLSEKDYMGGNLLGLEVRAEDVAQAFLHQALAERTTADVTTVDGGNIAAALR